MDKTDQADKISDHSRQRISYLYPSMRSKVYRVIADINRITGKNLQVAQGLRSIDEQLELFKEGRELKDGKWVVVDFMKIKTNSPPGMSFHNFGLAWDACFCGEDPYLIRESKNTRNYLWAQYGRIGKAHGFEWSGDWHPLHGLAEVGHLQMRFGLTITQLMEIYSNHGSVAKVWSYLDKVLEKKL